MILTKEDVSKQWVMSRLKKSLTHCAKKLEKEVHVKDYHSSLSATNGHVRRECIQWLVTNSINHEIN
jgi:hypothetical protein